MADDGSIDIWVQTIGEGAAGSHGRRAFSSTTPQGSERRLSLPIEKLKLQLQDLTAKLTEILSTTSMKNKEFVLDEVTLSAEITAEGGFSLLGFTEGKAGGRGGVELKFKRNQSEPDTR